MMFLKSVAVLLLAATTILVDSRSVVAATQETASTPYPKAPVRYKVPIKPGQIPTPQTAKPTSYTKAVMEDATMSTLAVDRNESTPDTSWASQSGSVAGLESIEADGAVPGVETSPANAEGSNSSEY